MQDFVALVSALAWPLTVLILVYLFRREFRQAASRLSSLKYKDFQADFARELASVEDEIKLLPPTPTTNGSDASATQTAAELSSDERLLRLAEISPRAAITEAWRDIELSTIAAAKAYGISTRGHVAGVREIHELAQRRLLPQDVVDIYGGLRRLRNEAVHANEFLLDQDQALQFIALAQELQRRLADLVDRAREHERAEVSE